jgi:Protein of unknown function (DUF2750)
MRLMETRPRKAADRYGDLIARATQTKTLWALMPPGESAWVTYRDPRDHVVIPLWPGRDEAAAMATSVWRDAVATPIPVSDFLKHEVDALETDGVQIAAHPTPTSSGAAVRAAHFARALRDAMDQ